MTSRVTWVHVSWFQESERERNEDKHRSQKVRDRREIEQKEAEMKVVTEPIEGINQHPDDGMSPFLPHLIFLF